MEKLANLAIVFSLGMVTGAGLSHIVNDSNPQTLSAEMQEGEDRIYGVVTRAQKTAYGPVQFDIESNGQSYFVTVPNTAFNTIEKAKNLAELASRGSVEVTVSFPRNKLSSTNSNYVEMGGHELQIERVEKDRK